MAVPAKETECFGVKPLIVSPDLRLLPDPHTELQSDGVDLLLMVAEAAVDWDVEAIHKGKLGPGENCQRRGAEERGRGRVRA